MKYFTNYYVQYHFSYSRFEFSQCAAEREECTTAGEKQHGCWFGETPEPQRGNFSVCRLKRIKSFKFFQEEIQLKLERTEFKSGSFFSFLVYLTISLLIVVNYTKPNI